MKITVERVDGQEDIEILSSDFQINEFTLDQEICNLPGILCKYGDIASDLRAEVSRKKAALEYFDSAKYKELKLENDKLTVSHIEADIKCDDQRRELRASLIESERNSHKADNLYRSLLKKADLVIALAYKQRSELKNIQ